MQQVARYEGLNNPPTYMLNFGCQPCSLYREDFFCSSLKLFGSIRIAYSFYNQTLVFKIHNPVVPYSENKAISTPLIKPA